MMILPALIYTLVKRNYIYSITYVFAIFITRGLGGIISLAIITPLYVFYSFRNSLLRYTLIITLILTSLIFSNYIFSFYANRIESKGLSTTVRISNITEPLQNIDLLIKLSIRYRKS